MPPMNETETQMCEQCGELPATHLSERGNVGECVCSECMTQEQMAAMAEEEQREKHAFDVEEYCEGW